MHERRRHSRGQGKSEGTGASLQAAIEDAWENAKGHQAHRRAGTSSSKIKVETEQPDPRVHRHHQPDRLTAGLEAQPATSARA